MSRLIRSTQERPRSPAQRADPTTTVVCAGITEVVAEVSTREGKYANLPCGLDSPVNLKDEVFDWKKEQQEEFFYKGKDYNNQGREGQDPQFVGRVRLLPGGLQASKASMILSSVTQADSGVHKMRASEGKVLVQGPGRGVGVGSGPGQRAVEPQLRPEVEEASPSSGWVRLSCLSSGGQPQPSGLEWQTPNGTVIPAEEAPTGASSDSDGRYSISQTVKVPSQATTPVWPGSKASTLRSEAPSECRIQVPLQPRPTHFSEVQL
ncbi:unnamed protein product [Gadus morhua 'NCC']